MTPFLVYYDDSTLSGFRLKAEQTGHSVAHHFRLAAQQYLNNPSIQASLCLSGRGICSGTLFVFQVGG